MACDATDHAIVTIEEGIFSADSAILHPTSATLSKLFGH